MAAVVAEGSAISILLLAARVMLGLVFVAAAIAKIGGREAFESTVRNYLPLRRFGTRCVALVVTSAEACFGGMLLVGVLPVEAAGAIALMLTSFAAVTAVHLLLGRSFDCGCGVSPTGRRIGWRLVAEDALLAAVALAVAIAAPPAVVIYSLGNPALLPVPSTDVAMVVYLLSPFAVIGRYLLPVAIRASSLSRLLVSRPGGHL